MNKRPDLIISIFFIRFYSTFKRNNRIFTFLISSCESHDQSKHCSLYLPSGFIMYFRYGIKNSSLEEANTSENVDDIVIGGTAGNIELTVTDHHQRQQQKQYSPDHSIYESQQLDVFGQPVFGSTNFGGTPNQQQHTGIGGHQQRQTGTAGSGRRIDQTASTTTGKKLFIDQDSFPTWDD